MGTSALTTPSLSAARRHAIICVLSASATFTVGSALVKALTEAVPIMEIVMARALIGFAAMLPMLWRQGGWAALATQRPLGHALRAATGFIGTVTTIYGYTALPLATVTALGFAMPLFLTMLSVPLLGERVGGRRVSAVLAGLGGVLIMLQPWHTGGDALPIGPVLVVLSGVVAWALSMISIRRMGSAGERNLTIVAWYSLGTAALAAVSAIPNWVTPSIPQLAALAVAGVLSAIAQLLMTEGYRAGEATLVAPFEYGAILYATILGAVFWGEWPDGYDVLGVAILISAGLYIWHREVTLGITR